MSLDIVLHVGNQGLYDAKEEVYDPSRELMKLCLPSQNKKMSGNLIAPGATTLDLLMAGGAEMLKTVSSFSSDVFTKQAESARGIASALDSNVKYYSVRIGNMILLPWAIISKAEPSYSKDVDERGYPMTCKMTIDVSSAFVATTELIESWKDLVGPGIHLDEDARSRDLIKNNRTLA